jgi:hypothetical protein
MMQEQGKKLRRLQGFAASVHALGSVVVIGPRAPHNSAGRLAADVSLANRVRSGRKQP